MTRALPLTKIGQMRVDVDGKLLSGLAPAHRRPSAPWPRSRAWPASAPGDPDGLGPGEVAGGWIQVDDIVAGIGCNGTSGLVTSDDGLTDRHPQSPG